jgi:hypothetical protein
VLGDGRRGVFSLRQELLKYCLGKLQRQVGYAVAQVDPSGLSTQRNVFDAGPVRVICCDGRTGIGTGVFPMNSVSPSQGQ